MTKLPHGALLVTLDVSSLYTNIPNNEGIRACAKALLLHRSRHHKPQIHYLIGLLRMVLTMNNFEFNGEHYLQTGGTAMGTRVAPSFANLFMADFEEKYVYTHEYQPHWWKRYIDDIFMIWTLGQEKLDIFISFLNSCHPNIKFTHETSTTCLSFLDTNVKMDSRGNLYTDLYSKPTDTHNYLRYESCHPYQTKSGLPFSELLRVRRICTLESDFQFNAIQIIQYFIRQGYPETLLHQTLL